MDSATNRRAGGVVVPSAGRLRQEVIDTRRRTLIGGVFYLFGWTLLAAYSPLPSEHPWLTAGLGLGFLVLAVLRFAVRPASGEVEAQRRWLDWQWGVVLLTAVLWGAGSAFVIADPRFEVADVPALLSTVAFATACAHTLSMRRARAMVALALLYLPALVTMWTVDPGNSPAWALLVYLGYLVLALLSSHGEYRLRLDLDEQLRVQRDRFETLSRLDALTGLANRRHFSDTLAAEVAQAHVGDQPLALLIVDIDHFKRFNDTHGHVAGDLALIAFADRLRERFGEHGVHLARVGGEEFALLLPRHTLDAAAALAERFRVGLAETPLPLGAGADAVRSSIGVGALGIGESGEALYLRTDRALYRAKREGRDRVRHAGHGDAVPA